MSQKMGNIISVVEESNNDKGAIRSCGFMPCKRYTLSDPVRFLKHVGGKVGNVIMSMKIKPSPKVSSSPGKSKPFFVTPVDSHRSAAIEDCIEFINSSAALPRSNSVSANSQ